MKTTALFKSPYKGTQVYRISMRKVSDTPKVFQHICPATFSGGFGSVESTSKNEPTRKWLKTLFSSVPTASFAEDMRFATFSGVNFLWDLGEVFDRFCIYSILFKKMTTHQNSSQLTYLVGRYNLLQYCAICFYLPLSSASW